MRTRSFRYGLDPEIARSIAARAEAQRSAAAAMEERNAARDRQASAELDARDAARRLRAARRSLSEVELSSTSAAAASWARSCKEAAREADYAASRAASHARLLDHRFRATSEHLDRCSMRVRTLEARRERALRRHRRQLDRRREATIEDEAQISAFARHALWSDR